MTYTFLLRLLDEDSGFTRETVRNSRTKSLIYIYGHSPCLVDNRTFATKVPRIPLKFSRDLG